MCVVYIIHLYIVYCYIPVKLLSHHAATTSPSFILASYIQDAMGHADRLALIVCEPVTDGDDINDPCEVS